MLNLTLDLVPLPHNKFEGSPPRIRTDSQDLCPRLAQPLPGLSPRLAKLAQPLYGPCPHLRKSLANLCPGIVRGLPHLRDPAHACTSLCRTFARAKSEARQTCTSLCRCPSPSLATLAGPLPGPSPSLATLAQPLHGTPPTLAQVFCRTFARGQARGSPHLPKLFVVQVRGSPKNLHKSLPGLSVVQVRGLPHLHWHMAHST